LRARSIAGSAGASGGWGSGAHG